MKVVLASKNRHKAQEMQAILGDKITLVTQDEAGFADHFNGSRCCYKDNFGIFSCWIRS